MGEVVNLRKPKPLSEHAMAELMDIIKRPVPSQAVNPGVARKLVAEGLCIHVDMTSPFKTHRGARISHLVATDAGRDYIMQPR